MTSNTRNAPASKRSVHALALISLLVFAAWVSLATPALAGTVTNDRPLLFSFDGSDTTAGLFKAPSSIAVDESSGDVYVYAKAGEHGVVDKFDADGKAKNFPAGEAVGKSSLTGPPAGVFTSPFFEDDLAIDNSGGLGGPGEGEQGRIYVGESGGSTQAFDAQGNFLWTLPKSTAAPCGIDVDGQGHLWVVDNFGRNEEKGKGKAIEFANEPPPGEPPNTPPQKIQEVPLTANIVPCRIGVDKTGSELYVSGHLNIGSSSKATEKYVSGSWVSTLSIRMARDLAVDRSVPGGHVFVLHPQTFCKAPAPPALSCSGFTEFNSAGVEVGSFGDDILPIRGESDGIGYNASLDRVYVSDRTANRVKVFGPRATGNAPDVVSDQTDELEETEATAHATINPQGAPNNYHFEWAPNGNEVRHLQVRGITGTFKIWVGEDCCREYTTPEALPFNISPQALQEAIETLPPIGVGNVTVTGTAANAESKTPGQYDISFGGQLTGADPSLSARSIDLNGPEPGTSLTTTAAGPDWSTAKSSSLPYSGIQPTDSSPHAVSLRLTELNANTTYSVRLVGTNTTNHLRAYSLPDVFTTAAGPPPVFEGCSVSEISTESAHLACQVNPKAPTSGSWHVQTSTDPECASGFSDGPSQTLPAGEAPIAIEAGLEGLLPAQHYCVRVVATNGFAVTGSSQTVPFATVAIAPDEVSTAFAAPRSDTSARINGRVNPNGAVILAYRFEWSADGENWTALPEQEAAVDARQPILLSEEASGLDPQTTYHYRFGLVESFGAEGSGGPAASLGEEKTFTTRTSAEVTSPSPCPNEEVRKAQHADSYLGSCRGIELVNSPDKGNQHVGARVAQGTSPMRADGEEAIWSVLGGAPGGNTGAGATFLAGRTEQGWQSRGLIPPAEQQAGGGEAGGYRLDATTPDFSAFILNQGIRVVESGKTLVRLDSHQNQTLVREYPVEVDGSRIDLTDDGEHVLFVNPVEPRQLEDIGSGPPESISQMPDGLPNECGLDIVEGANSSFVGGGNGANTEGVALLWRPGYHMIATTDASRVYFQAKANGQPCEPALYGLYMRNRETEETTLIDPGASGRAPNFIRATPDGHQAYFLTYSKLDPVDRNTDPDVYRWDEDAEPERRYTCLTCVISDADVARTPQGILVSDDFSHVYFESRRQLIPGQGRAGDLNLYTLSGGEIHFVVDVNANPTVGTISTAELSTDGNVLLFETDSDPKSHRNLTTDRLASHCSAQGPGPSACVEIYRFEDNNASLECVSCQQGGVTENSIGVSPRDFQLSADGSTIAFVTGETLVPRDINHSTDIYEWRNGVTHLVTDGVTSFQTGLLARPQVYAVSASGHDILFSVDDPGLTGFEQDGFANLYDVRIGGGFEPLPPMERCEGDSCQAPLQPAPALPVGGGGGFHGHGNVEEGTAKPRCPKERHKVRRHGKTICIKRHPRKHHHRTAHANRRRPE